LVIKMTVCEFAGQYFGGFDHRDRHRLFHPKLAGCIHAQRYYLQLPIAKVGRLSRVLWQSKITFDHQSRPALVMAPVSPHRHAVLVGQRSEIFAGKQVDTAQGFFSIESLARDEQRHRQSYSMEFPWTMGVVESQG